MSKPKLHFAHANSYPAGTYRAYFEHLGRDFDIQALDMHGQNPAYPIDDGWRSLVDELIAELESRYSEPVILVGHSLGGMLSLMAAAKRPDLARCVLMLDSPVVAGWRAFLWRVVKWLKREDRFSPSQFSVRRRNQWPDAQAAHEHFAAKDIFAAWAPGVLEDYIEHGLMPHPEGVQLRFPRESETAIYRTLPHHVGSLLKNGLEVPVSYIAGSQSEENRLAGLANTRALVGHHFRMVEGGHLFPMEDPALAARLTRELICEMIGLELELCRSGEALRRA
ncbi:alpha/beta fold hydrolase [Massilia endophytica]|uniref:alpha/beta fold hydrolase n=1 Tax=Massilia endophytica TaxID=2899220 RepID=UPI001E5F1A2C|nr:alpha/beta hydrolase [Massilia endophytica]UGQ48432.1 alpha/beta hydrolase [Massilia endophytica]